MDKRDLILKLNEMLKEDELVVYDDSTGEFLDYGESVTHFTLTPEGYIMLRIVSDKMVL